MALSIFTLLCSHHCYLLCFQSISSSQREILYHSTATPLPPTPGNHGSPVCLNLPISGISHKRNHAVFVLLWLASFSWGFPSSSVGKESACSARDPGSIAGSGRSPGEGNGNPLQYSCLENPMDGGAGGLQSTGSQRVRHDCATNFPLLSFP